MSERIKKFPWGYILIGLLLLLVGISFIAFSSADMLSILAIVIGIITAIFGIAYGALTLANHDRGVKFVFRIVISVACIIAGLVAIIVRNDAVSAIVNVVCILLLVDGSFNDEGTGMFNDLFNGLIYGSNWQPGDPYYVLGDFDDYRKTRDKLYKDYQDTLAFRKKCFLNTVNAGKFSSDRTIRDYVEEVWKL